MQRYITRIRLLVALKLVFIVTHGLAGETPIDRSDARHSELTPEAFSAGETAGFTFNPDTSKPRELMGCRPSAVNSRGIRAGEEAVVREAAERASLGKSELLARLIYSESLSTGFWRGRCQIPEGPREMMRAIGWGISNRIVQSRKSQCRQRSCIEVSGGIPIQSYLESIFGPNQFRTSFSSKTVNPFASAFLCPTKAQNYLVQIGSTESANDLYRMASEVAESIVRKHDVAATAPYEYRKITHFFYPRSEHFGEIRPTWAPDKVPHRNRGYLKLLASAEPCVEFYDLHTTAAGPLQNSNR